MANDTEPIVAEPQISGDIPKPNISGEGSKESLGQSGDTTVDFSVLEKDPQFEAFLDKKLQSVKDSRLGKYGTRLENLEDAVAKYEALKGGKVDESVLSKMQGEQELADMKQALAELTGDRPDSSAGAGQRGWVEQQDTILENVGIDKGDARLTEFLRGNTFESHDEYLKALESQTFAWVQADAKKPKPSPSTVAQTISAVAPSDGDFKGITSDELGARAIKLGKEYTKNQPEIERINKELERRDKIKE